ncbi:MAG: DUF502 domain-containing protein [Hyphomicrobiaceae bacterium]|nr:DUF502 domain-containing protein [Hyphomicrobiaceae bacterium]
MNDKSSGNEEAPQGLHKLAPSDLPVKKIGFIARLRNYFFTGLVVVGPVSITIYIIWALISFVDSWVKPLLPAIWQPETYGLSVPGIGVAFSILILILVGAFVANLFGRSIVGFGERMVSRMPVVRGVYGALKQIFETVLSQSHDSFQKVGIIEYPRIGLYSIVFVSTETSGEIKAKCDNSSEGLLSIFLPTTPNPTSGYLLFVPAEDVIILDMKVEDAAKMVISAGLVVPEYPKKKNGLAQPAYQNELKELAQEAGAAEQAQGNRHSRKKARARKKRS